MTTDIHLRAGVVPDISVIIVNWNSKDYLRACLQSLARHHPADLATEVIIVDGGSFDGCGEMLAKEFPYVVFIQSPDNIGFARANNLGARQARGQFLLLLNPDTEFVEDSLTVMHATLTAYPGIGAVGCRLLNSDRSLQTSCVQAFPTVLNQLLDSEFLRERFPRSALWGMQALHDRGEQPRAVEVLSGACILLRHECFEAVGGFSKEYFMYGEDLDLCFRIRSAGWKVCHVSTTRLLHHGGGSSRQAAGDFSNIMMRASVHRFIKTHQGPMAAAAYRITTSLGALVRLVLIAPLMLFGNGLVRHGTGSLRKWIAVFRWSLGWDSRLPAGRPDQTKPQHT